MSRKQHSRKQRPTFRQIYDVSPLIQQNLFMAAISFGLVALLVVITLVVYAAKTLFF